MNNKHTIKELIENCSSKRIENTPEYIKSVKESNNKIKEYLDNKSKVYAEADNFIANSNDKSLIKTK